GVIEETGSSTEVINHYFSNADTYVKLSDRAERVGKGAFRFTDYRLHNRSKPGGEGVFFSDDKVSIELHYKISEAVDEIKAPHVAISITHQKFGRISTMSNLYSGMELHLKRPSGRILCHLDELVLLPGTYYVNVFSAANGERQDVIQNALCFDVLPQD